MRDGEGRGSEGLLWTGSQEGPCRRGDLGAVPERSKTKFLEEPKEEHFIERDQSSTGPRAM